MITDKVRTSLMNDNRNSISLDIRQNHISDNIQIEYNTGDGREAETVEFYFTEDGELRMSFQTKRNRDDNAPRYNVVLATRAVNKND